CASSKTPPNPPFEPCHNRSKWRTQSSGVPIQARPDATRYSAESTVMSGGMMGNVATSLKYFEVFQAEFDVRPRPLPRFRRVREGNDPSLAAVGRLAAPPRPFLGAAPIAGMRFERLVRGAPDRKHADFVLASGHGADRRPVRCNRHFHHRLRIAFELQTRF